MDREQGPGTAFLRPKSFHLNQLPCINPHFHAYGPLRESISARIGFAWTFVFSFDSSVLNQGSSGKSKTTFPHGLAGLFLDDEGAFASEPIRSIP